MKILNCIKGCINNKNLNQDGVSGENNKDTSKKDITKSGYVSIEDFTKLDLRVGKIKKAEPVDGSSKLIKCLVDFGELGERVVVSGILQYKKPEEIENNKYLYIVNLKPRKIFGIESQAMLVALSSGTDFAMLQPDYDIKEGTKAG